MSIADKLTRLRTARDNIIAAINNKGVVATGHGFEDFPTDISQITGGGGITPTGTVEITASGDTNVYNYATAHVDAGSATPALATGTVIDHHITLRPYVTKTAGYIEAGLINGDAKVINASDLVDGTLNVTANGNHDVTNYETVAVNVPTGGTYQTKSVTPNAEGFSVTPDSGYDALSQVSVAGDEDLVASNIKSGVEIFGVTGTYAPRILARQDDTITDPYLPAQLVYTLPALPPARAYDGQGGFRVNISEGQDLVYTPEAETITYMFSSTRYLTKSITINGDDNLVAGNVKKDVTIFGVTGTYEQTTQEKVISPTAAGMIVVPDSGYDALSSVTVNGDSNLLATNIRKDVTIFGVTGVLDAWTYGSLIVVTHPTTVESISATYNGVTWQMYMTTGKSYINIPASFTGDVTITATSSIEEFNPLTVTISDVAEYDVTLSSSYFMIFDGGTWGITNPQLSGASMTISSGNLVVTAGDSSESTLTPAIDTSTYKHLEIVVTAFSTKQSRYPYIYFSSSSHQPYVRITSTGTYTIDVSNYSETSFNIEFNLIKNFSNSVTISRIRLY